jgi:outer membrane protein OmpA-like peptidoglycan-associated protein
MKKAYALTKAVIIVLAAANTGISWSTQTNWIGDRASRITPEIKSALFQTVDQAMAAAKAENADMLAPEKFHEGLKRYREAEKRFEQGEKLANIYAELNATLAAFQQAQEATKLAKVTFSSALEARADAEEAGAPQFATKAWHKAEEKLLGAAKALEEGDLNGARKATIAAAKEYRQAQFEAARQNPVEPKAARSFGQNGRARSPKVDEQELLDKVTKENSDQITLLKRKVDELEQALQAKNKAQAETVQRATPSTTARREAFAPLENLFARNEGIVLKRGNEIVVRLYGLDFVDRNAEIELRHVHLLAKVKQALEMLAAHKITIEGHSYVYGTVVENLEHSRERAEAVKSYLQENLAVYRPAIVAIGYGDTSPIPTRELNNGHLGNNRIDIVIHLTSGETS